MQRDHQRQPHNKTPKPPHVWTKPRRADLFCAESPSPCPESSAQTAPRGPQAPHAAGATCEEGAGRRGQLCRPEPARPAEPPARGPRLRAGAARTRGRSRSSRRLSRGRETPGNRTGLVRVLPRAAPELNPPAEGKPLLPTATLSPAGGRQQRPEPLRPRSRGRAGAAPRGLQGPAWGERSPPPPGSRPPPPRAPTRPRGASRREPASRPTPPGHRPPARHAGSGARESELCSSIGEENGRERGSREAQTAQIPLPPQLTNRRSPALPSPPPRRAGAGGAAGGTLPGPAACRSGAAGSRARASVRTRAVPAPRHLRVRPDTGAALPGSASSAAPQSTSLPAARPGPARRKRLSAARAHPGPPLPLPARRRLRRAEAAEHARGPRAGPARSGTGPAPGPRPSARCKTRGEPPRRPDTGRGCSPRPHDGPARGGAAPLPPPTARHGAGPPPLPPPTARHGAGPPH
ncbi:uncharacterized protein LOC142416152 [Mycteria americana]|uniref:uncharacterized protein LOC142416152 n=1 Tax=Mycteria americana TaxID=33587 RepID=UPI003F58BE23